MKPRRTLRTPLVALLAITGCATQDTPAPAPPAPLPEPAALVPLAPLPSAGAAAMLVWSAMEAQAGEKARLHMLRSSTVPGDEDRPDRVRVRLDLVFLGRDVLEATRFYVELLDALGIETWCANIERGPTRVLDEPGALAVDGLEVVVLAAAPDPSGAVPAIQGDPERTARRAAAGARVGPIQSSVATRRSAARVIDTVCRIRPVDREQGHLLDQILGFFEALERDLSGTSITSVVLRPRERRWTAEEVSEWTFDVELTSRAAAEG